MTSPISAPDPSLQGSPSDNPPLCRSAPPLPAIARAFLVIGSLAFGGQGGLLALLSRDLVERRKWVEESEITAAFTYVQLLPGAVVVQVVAYLGFRLRGWRGAVVAAICFLLPSVIAMLLLAAMYRRLTALAGVSAALNGLTAAVVGLIALAAYKQARKTIKDAIGVFLAAAVCAASVWRHLNPAILVVGAGLIGVAREAWRKETGGGEGDSGNAATVQESAAQTAPIVPGEVPIRATGVEESRPETASKTAGTTNSANGSEGEARL